MTNHAVIRDDEESGEWVWVHGIRVKQTRYPHDDTDERHETPKVEDSVGGTPIIPTAPPLHGDGVTRIHVQLVPKDPFVKIKGNANLSKAAVAMVAFTSLQPLLHCMMGSKYILQVYHVSTDVRDALVSSVFTSFNYSILLAIFFSLVVFLMTVVDHIPRQTWGVKMPPAISVASFLLTLFLNLMLLYHFLYGEGEEGIEAYYLDLSRLVVSTTINQGLALIVSGEQAPWWLAFTTLATPFTLGVFWLKIKCLEIARVAIGDAEFCLITCHLVLMLLLTTLTLGLWIAQVIMDWPRYQSPHENKTDYINTIKQALTYGTMAIIGGGLVNVVYPLLSPFALVAPVLIKATQILILDFEIIMATIVLSLDILDRGADTEKTLFTREWKISKYDDAWLYTLCWLAIVPAIFLCMCLSGANSAEYPCLKKAIKYKILAVVLTCFYTLCTHILRNFGFCGIYGNIVPYIEIAPDNDSRYFQGVNVFISYVGLALYYLMMRPLMYTYDTHHEAHTIGITIMESGLPNHEVLLWPF